MITTIIFICLSLVLIILGYQLKNGFFSLMGAILLLITSLVLISNPLTYQVGYTLNTSSALYTVEPITQEVNSLIKSIFSFVMLFISLFVSYSSIKHLQSSKRSSDDDEL